MDLALCMTAQIGVNGAVTFMKAGEARVPEVGRQRRRHQSEGARHDGKQERVI